MLTQYLQFVLGYSPVKAGLAFVPLAVAALDRQHRRRRTRRQRSAIAFLVLAGMLVMASSFALLTTSRQTPASPSRRSRSDSSASAPAWRCRQRSAH